jgi:folate-binding protein YgfZ
MTTMDTPSFSARLTSRALARVAGPDWRGFLQGLLTQDVETLADGEMRYGALLNPQGKLLYDLFLIGEADGCLIDVAAAHRDALIQRLTIYRLRAKVEIAPAEGAVMALELTVEGAKDMPAPPGWSLDPRTPALGWRAVGEVPGGDFSDEAVYEAHRIALGVPGADDFPPETTYPIEANLDLLNGIDFQKGCFVGQETTSRMKRRGAIKSRMVGLAFEGEAPAFGAEVLNGDLRAGEVRSGVDGRALALVRLDRIEGDLTVDGQPVTVEMPKYIDAAVT